MLPIAAPARNQTHSGHQTLPPLPPSPLHLPAVPLSHGGSHISSNKHPRLSPALALQDQNNLQAVAACFAGMANSGACTSDCNSQVSKVRKRGPVRQAASWRFKCTAVPRPAGLSRPSSPLAPAVWRTLPQVDGGIAPQGGPDCQRRGEPGGRPGHHKLPELLRLSRARAVACVACTARHARGCWPCRQRQGQRL